VTKTQQAVCECAFRVVAFPTSLQSVGHASASENVDRAELERLLHHGARYDDLTTDALKIGATFAIKPSGARSGDGTCRTEQLPIECRRCYIAFDDTYSRSSVWLTSQGAAKTARQGATSSQFLGTFLRVFSHGAGLPSLEPGSSYRVHRPEVFSTSFTCGTVGLGCFQLAASGHHGCVYESQAGNSSACPHAWNLANQHLKDVAGPKISGRRAMANSKLFPSEHDVSASCRACRSGTNPT